MILTYTLLILYLIIILIITLIIIYTQTSHRNYLRRSLPIQTCAFSKTNHHVIQTYGNIPPNTEGLISYCLFGNYSRYINTLYNSIINISTLMSNWYPRIYVAIDIPTDILNKLLSYNVQVYIVGPNKPMGYEAALWRYYPASETLPFVSLDADDLFDFSISNNIKNWMKSNKIFATFAKHGFIVPLDAGKWGAKPINNKAIFPNIQNDINSYCEYWFGFDEAYLKNKIWPLFQQYGYYQCPQQYFLSELTIILIVIILSLMTYTIYLSTIIQ